MQIGTAPLKFVTKNRLLDRWEKDKIKVHLKAKARNVCVPFLKKHTKKLVG